MPFLLFSCLIELARTAGTLLNKSSKSRHFCLLSDPRWGSIQGFTSKYDVCCRVSVFFVDVLYQLEKVFLYS